MFDRGNASESCWRDIRQGFRHQGGTGERGHDWARKLLVAAERCWSRHPLGTNSGIYEHHHILKRRIGRWETVKILLRSFIIFANIANFTFQPKIGAYLWNGIWTKWKVVSELCETLLVYHDSNTIIQSQFVDFRHSFSVMLFKSSNIPRKDSVWNQSHLFSTYFETLSLLIYLRHHYLASTT